MHPAHQPTVRRFAFRDTPPRPARYVVWVQYTDGRQTLYKGSGGLTWSQQCPESIKLMTILARASNVRKVEWHECQRDDAGSAIPLDLTSVIEGVTAK